MVIWTGYGGEDPVYEQAANRASRALAELTGLPEGGEKPLRVLILPDWRSFQAYSAGFYGSLSYCGGYYQANPLPRAVLCGELTDLFPCEPGEGLAHEFAHHWIHSRLGTPLPPWLGEGLAVLASHIGGQCSIAPGTEARNFQVIRETGELIGGRQLLEVSYRHLESWSTDPGSTADLFRIGVVYWQGARLVGWLAGRMPGEFREFLARTAESGGCLPDLRDSFGLDADEAMQQWADGVATEVPPPHAAPPPELAARIDNELIAPLKDVGQGRAARRMLVRQMASAGWAWGAEALIEVLDGSDPFLRAEARRALENISGELRGGSAAAWREWLASLPPGVASQPPSDGSVGSDRSVG